MDSICSSTGDGSFRASSWTGGTAASAALATALRPTDLGLTTARLLPELRLTAARLLPGLGLTTPRASPALGNEFAGDTLAPGLATAGGATARVLAEIALRTTRDASSTGNELPAGTLTPAPQPLHRIFWPTRDRFAAKLRPQTGHANRTASPDSVSAYTGSIGAGTVATRPH
ncbi:MAG: hypothetical protein ACLQVF_40375 [Isosphaeraceae bacterium]